MNIIFMSFVEFVMLTEVNRKIWAFWDVTPCNLLKLDTNLSGEPAASIVRIEEL
jgi:hypothetical protein